ncbi:MAG: hypothetical protein EOO89_03565 [Pedobacter sp.]|nr:MAG: hypothetical protein EOO89_03565 [Pedobacter sp.]
MKKYAALIMAALYLLLTTGMYVCVLSCGTNQLVQLVKANSGLQKHGEKHNTCHEESEKNCNGNEDCSCCKKHGEFSVKENIKSDSTFELVKIPAISELIPDFPFMDDYQLEIAAKLSKKNAHPPPGLSPPIYIKTKSLLI